MFPAFVFWAYWIFFIPFAVGNYFVFIGVGPVSLTLTFMGYLIIKNNWKKVKFEQCNYLLTSMQPKSSQESMIPKATLSSLHVILPPDGGIQFIFSGTKPQGYIQTKFLLIG